MKSYITSIIPSLQYCGAVLIGALSYAFSFAEEPKWTNRLSKESSPYLLQHAHNPVDWYPWSGEALDRAKREKKLIFLSVGYSACHWCHVMERESFLDEEIASELNTHFICIKVDREERPDIDQIYMTAVQILTGRGGWPMSVFLTPDAKPIFGGTYFPARDGDRGASTGFLTALGRAQELWTNDRTGLTNQAEKVTSALVETLSASKAILESNPETNLRDLRRIPRQTQHELAERFDAGYGGFSYLETQPDRPKFPEPSNLLFLLQRAQQATLPDSDRALALSMLGKCLDSMIAGGIFDHIGGGFHRYSTDRYWRIPHFEKMLYDNAQLAQVYARAFELTGNDEYRSIAERTCDFAIRELRSPTGAFFASIDADSEGEEGKFYRWHRADLDAAAIEIDGFQPLADIYGLVQTPNFEGRDYVPQPGESLTAVAATRGKRFFQLERSLSSARTAMAELRAKRIRPPTDEKILTAWNGLMIAALADVGRIVKRPDYIAAATEAAHFVLRELKTREARLLRSYAGGRATLNGYLDDYAFLVYGLLGLHQATAESSWLEESMALMKTQTELFQDQASGVFFYTSKDHSELIVRFHDPVDGAIPSGNSVSAANLAYLSIVAQRSDYRELLFSTLRSSVPLLMKNPSASPLMATQIDRWLEWVDRP